MSTTAAAIITSALQDLQVLDPEETMTASQGAVCLRRLNLMMGSWALQPLTIPVIAREVFALTADVGTYTIGPGGDFDTTRPPSLIAAGLLLNMNATALTLTSLTSSGTVATATKANHGFADGAVVTIAGATGTSAPYNGTFTVTVPTSSTFTYVFSGTGGASASGTITALDTTTTDDNTLIEIPRAVLTEDAWQALQLKTMTNPLFTDVYYEPSYFGGLGTISLWPVPTTAEHGLVIYRRAQLGLFRSLTAQYDLPEGAEEAVQANLALRVASTYAVPEEIVAPIRALARTSLAVYKRSNVKMSDLPQDPATTADARGGYNIQTGTGG